MDVFRCESTTPTSSWKLDSCIAWYCHFLAYESSYKQRPYLFPSRGGETYPFLCSDVGDSSVGESIIFTQISNWLIIYCVLSLFLNMRVPSGMFCFENLLDENLLDVSGTPEMWRSRKRTGPQPPYTCTSFWIETYRHHHGFGAQVVNRRGQTCCWILVSLLLGLTHSFI